MELAEKKTGLLFDAAALREQFPVLSRMVHGKPLVYFDNAATAQRPLRVIEAMDAYYRHYNANVHRGVHQLSVEASEAFENARQAVRALLNAASTRELVYTRGTTDAINLVAQSSLRPRLEPGDEILITHMEHHANMVPWQLLCRQTRAVLKVAPINRRGELSGDDLEAMITDSTTL